MGFRSFRNTAVPLGWRFLFLEGRLVLAWNPRISEGCSFCLLPAHIFSLSQKYKGWKPLARYAPKHSPWSAGKLLHLMLVYARLSHVAGTQWGNKKYMNMEHLKVALEDSFIAVWLYSVQGLQTILRKILETTWKNPAIGNSSPYKAVQPRYS